MGHASSEAALRYQHATADRDRVIAQALSAMASPWPMLLRSYPVETTNDMTAPFRAAREISRGTSEKLLQSPVSASTRDKCAMNVESGAGPEVGPGL